MSQSRTPCQIIARIIDIRRPEIVDDHHYPPPLQAAEDQTSQQLSHCSDTSIPFFTLYLRIAEEHNRKKYELLKGELDSIIVFCGLFSATVAALVVPSIDSSTTPSDDSQSDDSQGSGLQVVNLPVINLLWIYSLIFSVYCALYALLLQRFSKPLTWVTSPRDSIPEQARKSVISIRRIERAEKSAAFIEFTMFPSLIIFFTGLSLYLFNIDLGTAIIAEVLIFTGAYPCFLILKPPASRLRHKKRKSLWPGFPRFTRSSPENFQERESQLDGEVLKRALDMSRSDDDLEQFLEAIPGFCTSKIVDNPRCSLDVLGLSRLAEALIGFWNRTLSSNRVSESVKVRRLVVCVRVIEAADLSFAVPQFLHLLLGDRDGVLRSAEIGRSWLKFRNSSVDTLSRGIIAGIISNAERNDRWFTLAMDEWGISEGVLRDYLAHGDSVSLANLIHITRHILHSLLQQDSDLPNKSPSILSSLFEFDILNTLPELQRDFCRLWNEVVQQARSSKADDNPFIDILVGIRRLYVDLHGADIALGYFFTSTTGHDDLFHQPASYPLCTMPDHQRSTTPTEEAHGSTTGGTAAAANASLIVFGSSSGGVLDVPHTATV